MIANIDGVVVLHAMASLLEKVRSRNLDRWLPGYARDLGRRLRLRAASGPKHDGPRHLLFALCDHYEPLWGKADDAQGNE
jgi:hypothetical protein